MSQNIAVAFLIFSTYFSLGQTCNHVAGLLFRIESANKLGLTSCTSGTCIWVKPSEKKLQPAQIKSMNFKKSRHGKSGRYILVYIFIYRHVYYIMLHMVHEFFK